MHMVHMLKETCIRIIYHEYHTYISYICGMYIACIILQYLHDTPAMHMAHMWKETRIPIIPHTYHIYIHSHTHTTALHAQERALRGKDLVCAHCGHAVGLLRRAQGRHCLHSVSLNKVVVVVSSSCSKHI